MKTCEFDAVIHKVPDIDVIPELLSTKKEYKL